MKKLEYLRKKAVKSSASFKDAEGFAVKLDSYPANPTAAGILAVVKDAGKVAIAPPKVALNENVMYTWSVSARSPDGRKYSSVADFSIAPQSLRQDVESLRPATTSAFSDRVAYAAWLEQAELKDEARKYWRALAAERPGDARLDSLAKD